MLDKCEEGTRYIHRNQFESAVVPNAFSVAYARCDECESRECRPGGETKIRSADQGRISLPVHYFFCLFNKSNHCQKN